MMIDWTNEIATIFNETMEMMESDIEFFKSIGANSKFSYARKLKSELADSFAEIQKLVKYADEKISIAPTCQQFGFVVTTKIDGHECYLINGDTWSLSVAAAMVFRTSGYANSWIEENDRWNDCEIRQVKLNTLINFVERNEQK